MRLAALHIKNFKRIGAIECKVRIDEIVVLIGPNNAGKSTVLDAYERFASSGKPLDQSHFHRAQPDIPVEITGVFNAITSEDTDLIGKKWVHEDIEYGTCVKVRFVWTAPEERGQKQSFDPSTGQFTSGGVGGWDSLFTNRIPKPTRICPTEPIDTTETKIVSMLKEHVKQKLRADSEAKSGIFAELEKLVNNIFQESRSEFEALSTEITASVNQMFPGIKLAIVPKAKDAIDEKLLAGDSYLSVSTASEVDTPLRLQGTGIQRALLWAALSAMSNAGASKKKDKTSDTVDQNNILLIDEPEAFLHPPTVREARETLYNFALNNPHWQVLATTHSPIFIDLAKPHTTILRVEASRPEQHYISTDRADFDVEARTRLQMVRACNPVVNEFFFYDEIVLVEGPTEHLVVKHVAGCMKRQIHVINCMGKANIPLFARILNQFKVPYIAIHDSDTPNTNGRKRKGTNAMWTLNEKIREAVAEYSGGVVFTQFPHFEGHFLDEELSNGKVDNVLDLLSRTESDEYRSLVSIYRRVLSRDSSVLTHTKEAFDRCKLEYVERFNLEEHPLWIEKPLKTMAAG
jgi:putative ATP-dependent endonuclease of OLD family